MGGHFASAFFLARKWSNRLINFAFNDIIREFIGTRSKPKRSFHFAKCLKVVVFNYALHFNQIYCRDLKNARRKSKNAGDKNCSNAEDDRIASTDGNVIFEFFRKASESNSMWERCFVAAE